jgi:Domain of unknown function (DUF4383)
MTSRTTVQTLAMVVGAVFLAVGILGFIPGITTDYDELAFAGEDSTAELLGIFQVSILHNIVHLLFGIAGLALARTIDGARTFLVGGGVIYLALAARDRRRRRLDPREHGRQLAALRARHRDDRARRPHRTGARAHHDGVTARRRGAGARPPLGEHAGPSATTLSCSGPPPSQQHLHPPAP